MRLRQSGPIAVAGRSHDDPTAAQAVTQFLRAWRWKSWRCWIRRWRRWGAS